MPTLQQLLKQRITTALKCGPQGVWKALIVDDYSRALLESVYELFDVLQMNITSVDALMSPRPPQPSLDAVYLLTPTTQNVNRIIADFQGRRTYRAIHLYFIDGIDDRLAERLTGSLPPDALQSFVELYCNFWPIESQVFSIKSPSSFFTLFGNPGGMVAAEMAQDRFEEDVRLIGRSILNLLATLNENPLIRFYNPTHHPPLGPLAQSSIGSLGPGGQSNTSTTPSETGGGSQRWKSALGGSKPVDFTGDQICKRLAMQIQRDLDEYKQLNPEFPAESNPPRPKAVLFVVDRSMDPVAPFLHEFTYQAMVNDLLPVQDGKIYKYKFKNAAGHSEEKVAVLSDEDKIWTSVRHMHMKEAIDTLMMDFNKFNSEHAQFNSGTQASMDDMKDMLASLPEFQETRDKFSLHLDMAQECMALFEQKKLAQTANVEQCCATGVTPEGKNPKTLVEEMVPLLDDRQVVNRDKVRIIATYILFRDGVPDEDRKRLFQHARLSLSEQEAVNNLVYLGSKVVKSSNDRVTRSRIKQKPTSTAEEEFELSRYKPVIKQVLEEHVSNKLDSSMFPYVRDAPGNVSNANLPPTMRSSAGAPPLQSNSLRTARPTWHKAPSARAQATTEGRQRIILFIAGGLTYSEQRQAYLVGKALGKEVIIGSTHQLTPEIFVNDMKNLGRGGIGGQPPNAAPPSPYAKPPSHRENGQVPYQGILDSRIWSEPVGPPPIAPPPQMMQQQQQQQQGGRPYQPQNGGGYQQAPAPAPSGSSGFMKGKKDKKDKDSYRDSTDSQKKKSGLFKMKWGE